MISDSRLVISQKKVWIPQNYFREKIMPKHIRPNFCVIGAMKTGSTSLNSYLKSHPDVFMSEIKEPGYFVKEIAWDKGEDWYLSLFEKVHNEKIIGEASTHYTKLPKYKGVLERIKKFNPDMKFVYVMRDPVKRTISHYWHNVRIWDERRDPLTAVQKKGDYLDFSYYAMQLKPYFELFGKENVYILTHEEMISSPVETLHKIFQWLGVDSTFTPPNIKEAKFVTPPQVDQAKGFGVLHKFRTSDVWDSLHTMIPKKIRKLGRKLAEKKVDRGAVSTDKLVEYVRPIQREQTEELSKLLGRDFPEWTTLFTQKG